MIRNALTAIAIFVIILVGMVHAQRVQPVEVPGNPSCADQSVGEAEFKINDGFFKGTFAVPGMGTISVRVVQYKNNSEPKAISWSSTFDVQAVIVKGGSSANIYDYTSLGGLQEDNFLLSPYAHTTQTTISHILFCYRVSHQEIEIAKTIEGDPLSEDLVIPFELTKPSGLKETIAVTVLKGASIGKTTVLTESGLNIVEEPSVRGYEHVSLSTQSVVIPVGGSGRVSFVNKPTITPECHQELTIKKMIAGEPVLADLLIDFILTTPGQSRQTVSVVIPRGETEGSTTVRTAVGVNVVEEPDIPGFEHVGPSEQSVYIPIGGRALLSFVNRREIPVQEITIVKEIEGDPISEDMVIDFILTKPDNRIETVPVVIPHGKNRGSTTVRTEAGLNRVTEPDIPGFVHVSAVSQSVTIPTGCSGQVTFVNKREIPPEQEVTIVKEIQGDPVTQDMVIQFTLTKPGGEIETVTVVVPSGQNSGSTTVSTEAGSNRFEEPDVPGYDHVNGAIQSVDIAVGGNAQVTFVNRRKDAPTSYGCVDGYHYVDGLPPQNGVMVLVNEEGNREWRDEVNELTGCFKFHEIPFGWYDLYPAGEKNRAERIHVWLESQKSCSSHIFRTGTSCRPIFAWYNENEFTSAIVDTPAIGLYGTRDPKVYEYYSHLADRLDIDALVVRLDELMTGDSPNACNDLYKSSLIRGLMDVMRDLKFEFEKFDLKVIAAWDMSKGDLADNIQLLSLLSDSIMTHPSYFSKDDKKPLFFIHDEEMAQELKTIPEIVAFWEKFKYNIDTYLYPHDVMTAFDIYPGDPLIDAVTYIFNYVDVVYPRIDLSDRRPCSWSADGTDTGVKYLEEFYKKIDELPLPVSAGGTWVGLDDRQFSKTHYTVTADGDTVFNYIDKLVFGERFLTNDYTWDLAFENSPYWLIIESLNNYNVGSHIAPSTQYDNKITMDVWDKILKWKKDCYRWDKDENAIRFLRKWYRAEKSSKVRKQILSKAMEYFYDEDYAQAISLVEIVPADFALQFDGVDDVVIVPNEESLSDLEQFTIEFWLKTNLPMQRSRILEKGSWDEYYIGFYEGTGRMAGALRTPVSLSASKMTTAFGPSRSVVQQNRWTHVAAVFDGEKTQIFTNGINEVERTAAFKPRRLLGDLIIGAVKRMNGFEYHFNGLLDDLRIWNIARTSEEIVSDMNNAVSGDEPSLILAYDFNEGSGQIVRDVSSFAHVGYLGVSNASDVSDPTWIESDRPLNTGPGSPYDSNLNKDYSSTGLPFDFELLQNHPNPFNPRTTIVYRLPHETHVRLDVFDISGRLVTNLVDAFQNSGEHSVYWNAATRPSGVYFYQFKAGDFSETRRMILVK